MPEDDWDYWAQVDAWQVLDPDDVKAAAQQMADMIDAQALEHVLDEIRRREQD